MDKVSSSAGTVSPMPKSTDAFIKEIETLEDLLFAKADLKENLIRGLEQSLTWLRRSSGAFFINDWDTRGLNPWVSKGAVEHWDDAGTDPNSTIRVIAREVMAGKQQKLIPTDAGTAQAVPLVFNQEVLGTWFILGEALSPAKTEQLVYLSKVIGRAISTYRSLRGEVDGYRDVAALQIVAATLNPDASVNDVQLWIMRGIKDLLGCPAVSLTLLDDQVPDLAVKKVLVDEADWHSQEVIQVGPSLVQDTLRAEQDRFSAEIDTDTSYNETIDGIDGIHTQTVLSLPLISNRQTLGVVQAINVAAAVAHNGKMNLLNSMSRSLANSVFNLRLIQQLKVINADLEASRWELLHSRNTLRTLFDSMPSSIYIIDRRYTLIAINLTRSDRVGIRPNQLVGKKCYSVLYQRVDPCPACRVKETLMQGKMTNRVNRTWVTPDQAIDWDISTFPIFETAQLPVQAIVLEQDITEKRRLEANLIQNEKLAAVGQLAAGVAHEINNPLSAIIANAQILRSELDPNNKDAMESVDLIEMAGMRASQVVRNLLGFARKETYDFTVIDLNETISSSLSLIQHEVISRPIKLTCDLGEDLPKIKASRDHLQGVWINMILNAIDAMDGGEGEIHVSTRYQINEFRVNIQDTGKGIAPERISRIFEPFYTTKSSGRGTGLGLSVCHRIIKQHGGYIQVESNPGVGTKFVIVLPGGDA
jgi:two-component system, NtrC family, sensor kinase